MNTRTTIRASVGRGVSVRPGMTFLEVVVASAMLGVVSAAMFGVFSFVTSSQWREQRRLGATEVANRLVLQYLDSPTEMPDPSKTVDYGPAEAMSKYRWEYTEDTVALIEAAPDQRDSTRVSPLDPNRFKQITVRVWLSEHSGGSRSPEPSTPMATLTRMLDPVMPRNPDSYMNMLQDPTGFSNLMSQFMGFGGNTGGGGTTVIRNGGLQSGQRQTMRGQQGAIGPGDAFRQGRQRNGQQQNGRGQQGRGGQGGGQGGGPRGGGGTGPGGGGGGGGIGGAR